MRESSSRVPPPRHVGWATSKQKAQPVWEGHTQAQSRTGLCLTTWPLHQAASDAAASYPRVSKLTGSEPKTEATFSKHPTLEMTPPLFCWVLFHKTSSPSRPGHYPGMNGTRVASLGTVSGAAPARPREFRRQAEVMGQGGARCPNPFTDEKWAPLETGGGYPEQLGYGVQAQGGVFVTLPSSTSTCLSSLLLSPSSPCSFPFLASFSPPAPF